MRAVRASNTTRIMWQLDFRGTREIVSTDPSCQGMYSHVYVVACIPSHIGLYMYMKVTPPRIQGRVVFPNYSTGSCQNKEEW